MLELAQLGSLRSQIDHEFKPTNVEQGIEQVDQSQVGRKLMNRLALCTPISPFQLRFFDTIRMLYL